MALEMERSRWIPEIWEAQSTGLGGCLSMKGNDEKREEARMTPYFVSLWMVHPLLRLKNNEVTSLGGR